MRNFILEGKKIAKPVLVTTCLLTLLTCILSCTLYRGYTLHFELDAWEIGTEFLSLLFRSVYKELHADHETGAADNK
ncbi:hypothetical protein [Hungatella hathewayi]|uniref:hypothetical protein n=1 Tax=Hungatella hathewayi TaxID=154046 RepID=UPI0026DBC9C6|nr:hypothetical protein [Hungatella hathewayi]